MIDELLALPTSSDQNSLIEFKANVELDYRGYHIEFFPDSTANQMCAEWKGQVVGFGINNVNYEADMKKLIDETEDLIVVFKHISPNLRLKYFDNAGKRDIKLVYRGRVLKVYVLADQVNDLEWIKRNAINFFTCNCSELLDEEEKI